MYQPEFHRFEEVWDDREERSRARDAFPLAETDLENISYSIAIINSHMIITHERPVFIQGAVNGEADFIHGGGPEFVGTYNARITRHSDMSRRNVGQPSRVIATAGAQAEQRPQQNVRQPQSDAVSLALMSSDMFGNLSAKLRMFIIPVNYVLEMLAEHPSIKKSMRWLHDSHSVNTVNNWGAMIMMNAALHPSRENLQHYLSLGRVPHSLYGFIPSEFYSVNRAAHMLVGRRGVIHGWGRDIPDIRHEIFRGPYPKYVYPVEWAPSPDTDGGSSYHSDSPGHYDDENDSDFGGPRGVIPCRPPVTGMSSDEDIAYSFADAESSITDELNIFLRGGPQNPAERREMARFVRYMKKSNKERRSRRDVRRARREERLNYDAEHRRISPLFDMEAKRAEAIAAEKMRYKILNSERERSRQVYLENIEKVLGREHGVTEIERSTTTSLANDRCQQFLRTIRQEVVKKWLQQVDHKTIKLQDELKKDGKEMKYHCWMSPVHWVRQTGTNCGLAVISMATHPVMKCEVAMDLGVITRNGYTFNNGSVSQKAYKKARDMAMFRAIKHDLKQDISKSNLPVSVFPPDIKEMQRVAVINEFSGHGEMFSALAMATLASWYTYGQYRVYLVNRHLLTELEKTNFTEIYGTTAINGINTESENTFVPENSHCLFDSKDSSDTKELVGNENVLSQQLKMSDQEVDSRSIDDNRSLMDDNYRNSASHSSLQQNEQSTENQSKFKGFRTYGRPDDEFNVTIDRDDPLWKMSVVQHLMSGHNIAVCYDCDRNMKPFLYNEGHTAHWALLCGVIVGRVNEKENYQTTADQFIYNTNSTQPNNIEPLASISKNDVIDGTGNAGNSFVEQGRRVTHRDRSSNEINVATTSNTRQLPDDFSSKDNNNDNIFYKDEHNINGDNVTDNKNRYENIMNGVDLNNVWVIARHGKTSSYDVWSLNELAMSNQQLRIPDDRILSNFWSRNEDEDTVQKLMESFTLSKSKCVPSNVNQTNDTDCPSEINSVDITNKSTEENQASLSSNSLSPPPPPPPPPPPLPVQSASVPTIINSNMPFVLPQGVRLDKCLAKQFIVFKPVNVPHFISDSEDPMFNFCCAEEGEGVAVKALQQLLCYFSFDPNKPSARSL